MNQVNCPICGKKCVKSGNTKAGSQRWICKNCKASLTHKINNQSKELQIFLNWLFGKEAQSAYDLGWHLNSLLLSVRSTRLLYLLQ